MRDISTGSVAIAVLAAACSSKPPAPAMASPRDAQVARSADAAAPPEARLAVTPVALPGGEGGIGFDDLQYSAELGRVLVPAGRSGALDLLDPASGSITQITGFSADPRYGGGHGEGTTSAVVGGPRIFAIDRDARRLDVVDPDKGVIVAHAKLAASPDYVRWIARTGEVWVTEPDAEQIEVFTIGDGTPRATATIRVAGGPESLVLSARRGVAYTHLWDGKTVAIDVATRKATATWSNGCQGSRGIGLDDERGWLFVGCAEGKATVLDVDHAGQQLGAAETGAGVDIIAYAPSRRRLYVPGAKAGSLSVLEVGEQGGLTVLATVPVAKGSHCAVTDDAGQVWVCDPAKGQLLAITGTP